ncbi:unnamed protein product [Urochloa decumbens]|uniref:KIB1-4 beta-propeller domain-containing protein n=1 Tax=Urochloa decumbens TaxID=240449 RepID=A0ABC9B578_9POAL
MELTAPRRLLMPREVAADDARYVGSYDGWVVGVTQIKVCSELGGRDYFKYFDGECFLVNAFSQRVVRLPRLCRTSYIFGHFSCKILPVINGSGDVHIKVNGLYTISPHKVVLSASPDSGSKYIVAASYASTNLALWQSGMTSWHICTDVPIDDGPNDIAFYQGKLYMFHGFIPRLLAFVLDEDDCGIVISRVEQCVTEPLLPLSMEEDGSLNCNMVVWRGNLLLVLRYYDSYFDDHKIEVEVFALDFSTNPYGLTRIHNFDGDCIFIGSGSSKSFPAGLHDGVEGDLIYFVPEYWSPCDRFVYNMRDGTMRPFSAKLLPLEGHVDDNSPVWLFPSE